MEIQSFEDFKAKTIKHLKEEDPIISRSWKTYQKEFPDIVGYKWLLYSVKNEDRYLEITGKSHIFKKSPYDFTNLTIEDVEQLKKKIWPLNVTEFDDEYEIEQIVKVLRNIFAIFDVEELDSKDIYYNYLINTNRIQNAIREILIQKILDCGSELVVEISSFFG